MLTALLISNALIFASIVVGYVYVRYFIIREVAAKNAVIEVLRAEVEYHKSRAAPNLVDEVKRLSEFAEESQVAKNTLNEELNRLRGRLSAEDENTKRTRLVAIFDGVSVGGETVIQVIHETAKQFRATDITNREFVAMSLDALADGIAGGFNATIETVRKRIAIGG